jgi:hypothetical protein
MGAEQIVIFNGAKKRSSKSETQTHGDGMRQAAQPRTSAFSFGAI